MQDQQVMVDKIKRLLERHPGGGLRAQEALTARPPRAAGLRRTAAYKIKSALRHFVQVRYYLISGTCVRGPNP